WLGVGWRDCCGAGRRLYVVVYACRPVGGVGDTVSLIIRRLGNRLRREHLFRYCDQLPIFLEEALSRRRSWKLLVVQAPTFRKSQISSLICAHRSKAEMDSLVVLAVAAGLY